MTHQNHPNQRCPQAAKKIRYNVHLFREMRLFFPGIQAESPQAAARLAAELDTCEAGDIEDCNGQDLGAMVDVAGDDTFASSEMIDFEPELQRQAANEMLDALRATSAWIDAQLGVERAEIQAMVRKAIDRAEGRAA